MSLFDYLTSQQLSSNDPSFASLIMAAFRKADTDNLEKLQDMWPRLWAEFAERYRAPGGIIPGEERSAGPVGPERKKEEW